MRVNVLTDHERCRHDALRADTLTREEAAVLRIEPMQVTFEVTDDYGVFYWIDDRLAYALTGKLDKAALLGLADRVYEELERRR